MCGETKTRSYAEGLFKQQKAVNRGALTLIHGT